ncbi:hypothetical protein LY76DRAFT_519558 [Colletotrichum caudatum]|nr:hypothetical protein LY76DRAFT_519558 [Colletotrichum caudatum]
MNSQKPVNYVVRLEALGDDPDFIDCPWCRSRQRTRVRAYASNTTRIASLFCCISVACIGAFVPFCFGWCSDVDHRCERCYHKVAYMPYGGITTAMYPPTSHAQPAPSQNISRSIYAPAEQG